MNEINKYIRGIYRLFPVKEGDWVVYGVVNTPDCPYREITIKNRVTGEFRNLNLSPLASPSTVRDFIKRQD